MARDWDAVAEAMRARITELDITQAELVQRSRLAPMTIRELLFNTAPRRRSDRTLAAVSVALGWPEGHLRAIAEGREAADVASDPAASGQVLAELADLKESVQAVNARLDALEQQADDGTRLRRQVAVLRTYVIDLYARMGFPYPRDDEEDGPAGNARPSRSA